MKKVFQIIGSILYGAVASYLLWLFFYWLTPIVMNMGWGWFLVYIFIAGGLLSGIIASLSTLLAVPLVFLTKDCTTAKIVQAIFFAFHGYCSIKLPWVFEFHYGFLQWLLAISLSIIILITFGSMIAAPFQIDDANN